MRLINFITSDGEPVSINPEGVESIKNTSSEWIRTQPGYDGPYTDIRTFSGQTTSVRESLNGTKEKLRYGDNT